MHAPIMGQSRPKRQRSILFDDELIQQIDAWRERQDEPPSRSAAVRAMLRRAINADAGARNAT